MSVENVRGQVLVGKMEPWLTDEDKGGIFFLNDNFEVELVSGEARDIPGNNFNKHSFISISRFGRLVGTY